MAQILKHDKYIISLRRGWKETDASGNVVRNDWDAYENQTGHLKPIAGELVVEYDNGIPRLKIGDGINEFSALPYMSVDSFILPKPISVTLYADRWTQVVDSAGNDVVDTYSQVVTVDNAVITPNSRVDLQPNVDQLCDFYDLGVALTAENDGGIITVYVVGDVMTKTYNIQATVTEVVVNEVTTDG